MVENDVKYLIRKVRNSLLWVFIPIILPILLSFGWLMITDHFRIEDIQKNKQDIREAYEYWTNIQLLVERKTALFEQYIIDDKADLVEIKRKIEKIEDEIRDIHKSYNPTRRVQENDVADILGKDYVKEVLYPNMGKNP